MLALPWIGTIVRDLSVNRFFHAMNMLYSTGGIRVEAMIRQAAACVDNHVARADFLRAAEVIESGGTIAAAFAVPVMIPKEYKSGGRRRRGGGQAGTGLRHTSGHGGGRRVPRENREPDTLSRGDGAGGVLDGGRAPVADFFVRAAVVA